MALALVYFLGSGQPPTSNLYFENLINGLSHNRVQTISQDGDGNLWVGTYSGLNRYNGVAFKTYEADGTEGAIPSNDVQQVLYSPEGDLWIATTNGLSRYVPSLDNFETFTTENTGENGLYSNGIHGLSFSDKRLWIATNTGVNFYEDNQFHRVKGLPQNLESEIAEVDQKGRVWVFSRSAIYYSEDNGSTFRNFTEENNLPLTRIYTMLLDANGAHWFGTNSSGLYRVEDRNGSFEVKNYAHSPRDPKSLGADNILSLFQDSKGILWVGTENAGLNAMVGEDRFLRYEADGRNGSVSSNSIWAMFEDNRNRFWVGTFHQGLNYYDPLGRKFSSVSKDSDGNGGLTHNTVSSIYSEGDEIWFSTDGGGLHIWDRSDNSWEVFTNSNSSRSIGSNAVFDVVKDTDGSYWIGTWAGGLNRFNRATGRFQKFVNDPSDPTSLPGDNSVFEMDIAENGDLWVATYYGGVALKRSGQTGFFNIGQDQGLSSNLVYAILRDSKGDIWAGTANGLNVVSFESEESFGVEKFFQTEDSTSLPANVINDVYEDNQSRIWVASKGGLSLLDRQAGTFQNFSRKEGLPSNEVQAVFQDQSGTFWVTTTKGLSRMREKEGQFEFRNYDSSDGLQGNIFVRSSWTLTEDGEIFIGGTNGFSQFTSDMVKDNPFEANTILTDLKIFNVSTKIGEGVLDQSLQYQESITLTHDQSVFTIDYIGISLTQGHKNEYAYRMIGLEENWNYVGTQTSATYTNLDPDTYTFEVMSSNNDGLWNETPTSLKVVILPPWWQTWWFRSIVILILVYGTFYIVRRRRAVIRQQQNILEEKVHLATREMERKNEDLVRQQELLQDAIGEINEILGKATQEGDFTIRISKENKEGEWLELANSLNLLFDTIMLPLLIVEEVVAGLAGGDLTGRYKERAKGQIEDLKVSMNSSMDQLSQLLQAVQQQSVNIADSTTEMQQASEEMTNTTTEITASIAEISAGSGTQLKKVDEVSSLLQFMFESSKSVDEQADSIRQKSLDGTRISEKGTENVDDLVAKISEVLELSKSALEVAADLKNKSDNISAVNRIVQDIAKQTNMLSLNAAIQAAQAGDAGRGFSVVAEEIRRLAESAQKSLAEIDGVIGSVQKGSLETTEIVEKMSKLIISNKEKSEESKESFAQMSEQYKSTLAEAQLISDSTKKQSSGLEEIVRIVEEVVIIAEEAAAGTEEIATSTSQLSAGMASYTDRSRQVKEIVDELMSRLQLFKLEE